MSKLTEQQRAVFAAVARRSLFSAESWYRAGDAGLGHPRGEAVTLASLHLRTFVERRTRADDAHAYEYRLAPDVLDVVREVRDRPVAFAEDARRRAFAPSVPARARVQHPEGGKR